jgi:hypothetical protein
MIDKDIKDGNCSDSNSDNGSCVLMMKILLKRFRLADEKYIVKEYHDSDSDSDTNVSKEHNKRRKKEQEQPAAECKSEAAGRK